MHHEQALNLFAALRCSFLFKVQKCFFAYMNKKTLSAAFKQLLKLAFMP